MLTASNDVPKPDGESAPAPAAPTPTNWKGVRHGLAHAERCLKAGELDEAEMLMREVLEFAPAEIRAWEMLAHLHQIRGGEAEAAHCRDKAERLRASTGVNKRPAASVQLAKLLWQQGECDTARAMLAILMLRRPEDERLQKLRDDWIQEN
jgi:predicted Zn-dependent protease